MAVFLYLVYLLGSTLGVILIYSMAKVHMSMTTLRSKLDGLPFLEDPPPSLLKGHLDQIVFRSHAYRVVLMMHELFGKTIAWMYRDQWAVSTIDMDLVKTIVIDEPQAHINRLKVGLPLVEFGDDDLAFAEGDQWRKLRRAIAPALKRYKTSNVTREIDMSINKFIGAIEARLTKQAEQTGATSFVMNADDLCHRFTLNLVYSCFFKQYHLIDFEADKDERVEMIEEGLHAMWSNQLVRWGVTLPMLKPIIDWLVWNLHPQGKSRRETMNFLKSQTKLAFEARKHLEAIKEQKTDGDYDEDNFTLGDGCRFERNMIDYVIEQFHDGKITQNEYFNSVYVLMQAGDKTQSDAITYVMYYISVDQQVQDKLLASILAEGVESQYLTWCIFEALRLMPPVSLGCSRVITRDIKVKDGTVPKGTFVVTHAYAVHRLRDYWGDDARDFRPERWSDSKNFHPVQFIGFGAGVRGCPGKDFSLHVMKKLFCAILVRYKFQCEPQDLSFEAPFLMLLLPDKPVLIEVSRRNLVANNAVATK